MKSLFVIAVSGMLLVSFAATAQTPLPQAAQTPEKPAGPTADTRGPGNNTVNNTAFCVKNAESGACSDCFTDGKTSSAEGTCKVLKESTTAPNVRKGQCSLPANQVFCKAK